MKFVYVAGPITKPDPMANTHLALKVAGELLSSGLVAPFVPHLTCFWQAVQPRSYEDWLAYDFEVIRRCDALLKLPGESPGADREMVFAVENNKPVWFTVSEVLDWARRNEDEPF